MKYYAGIGSRKVPRYIYELMVNVGMVLTKEYTLNTGGAAGSDTAFMIGCEINEGSKRVYYPDAFIPKWAFETVNMYHPAAHKLGEYPRRLHARNAMIILGRYGDSPVEFVICWTYGANGDGGTGQGIRIARAHNIPVYDLGHKDIRDAIKKRVIELRDGKYHRIEVT